MDKKDSANESDQNNSLEKGQERNRTVTEQNIKTTDANTAALQADQDNTTVPRNQSAEWRHCIR